MRGKIKTHQGSGQKVPFECIALLLQGGGALGAYQAGVYEALAEADLHPNWIAGISIGAINSALIAGNAPQDRVARLKSFWELITSDPFPGFGALFRPVMAKGNTAHKFINQLSAGKALLAGAPGFFSPRMPGPQL